MVKRAKDEALRQRVGMRIYFFRRRRGLTCLALAELAEVHRNTVYRAEAGISLCPVPELFRLARALDVKVDDFLQDAPELVHFLLNQQKSC
jgi:transcriptional regulator with XRE-family HTH domain